MKLNVVRFVALVLMTFTQSVFAEVLPDSCVDNSRSLTCSSSDRQLTSYGCNASSRIRCGYVTSASDEKYYVAGQMLQIYEGDLGDLKDVCLIFIRSFDKKRLSVVWDGRSSNGCTGLRNRDPGRILELDRTKLRAFGAEEEDARKAAEAYRKTQARLKGFAKASHYVY